MRGQPGFEARFPSYCVRCGQDIVPGQRVTKHRDTVIHVSCASGQDDE